MRLLQSKGKILEQIGPLAGEKQLVRQPKTQVELLRLQQLIIESKRFTKMGFRTEGGFVGDYERTTGEPIPDHISAKLHILRISYLIIY